MRIFIFISCISIFLFSSCKQCVECKYSTNKGPVQEKFCSSTKEDREDFEAHWDSLASTYGTKAICTKERF